MNIHSICVFCASTTHDVVFWLKTHFISCHPKCISNGFQMGCTDTNMSVLIRWLWWGNEMIIWWYDEMMTWCCCDFMIWWQDDMIIWQYGDIRNVMNVMQINDLMIWNDVMSWWYTAWWHMIWCYDAIMVRWLDDVMISQYGVIWWCDDTMIWWYVWGHYGHLMIWWSHDLMKCWSDGMMIRRHYQMMWYWYGHMRMSRYDAMMTWLHDDERNWSGSYDVVMRWWC